MNGLIPASLETQEVPQELQALDKGGESGRVGACKKYSESDGQEDPADPSHEFNWGQPPYRTICMESG
jgi:hypothetical protein